MTAAGHHIEEIEHTADWAIRVRARDWPSLFVGAAQGMFGLLADLSQVEHDHSFEIDLRAIDAETLLIDWLNELLYLAEERGIVFAGFAIRSLVANDSGATLFALARGGQPRELHKIIKAATFSGLSIQQVNGELQAEIVFDV